MKRVRVTTVYTSCCALNQMVASNDATFNELKTFIRQKQRESRYDWSWQCQGGAKALFCMTAPFEKNLEKNLKALGFEHIKTINRREGYQPGKIKMWILNW